MDDALLKTPLDTAHRKAGGRMVPFAGYEMPVQYSSIIAESKAVRDGWGVFDVSHMARLTLTGERVLEYLEWVTTNDVGLLKDGHGHYSLLPNERGGLVDDIIVYRVNGTEFRMVVNASNHAKDVAWLAGQNSFGVKTVDETEWTAMLAVQGPTATEQLALMSDQPEAVKGAGMFGVVRASFGGVHCFAARSGYTGEDGYELVCDAAHAEKLWNALIERGCSACGLGSRDVLRVEAGLPLYGHELSDDLSPIAAGLGWVIGKTKSFVGGESINAARANGTPQRLLGVKMDGKRLPPLGAAVRVGDKQVGAISSGVYSPLLERGIGFAFIDSDVKQETPCTVDLRGADEPGTLVGKRFFKRVKSSV